MTTQTITFTSTFHKEVYEGLTADLKYLSSKYIYDKKGDKLFQDIMAMPSYYLTDAEFEVLETNASKIAEFCQCPNGFDLIELGAGDGKKTKVLLRHFMERNMDFTYLPIDISQNALDDLETTLANELPDVNVKTQQGTYFEVLDELVAYNKKKKVILMLGSNIGNLLHPQAIKFLTAIADAMREGDQLIMGFDQKKDPQIILDAYNDEAGITAAFNKNVLHRINREMGANFNPDLFKHWEVYDPETGTAKSFLVSTTAQKVSIPALDLDITFKPWETIHTEISQKYDDGIVSWLADESGLDIDGWLTDSKKLYKNYIFKKK